MMAAAIMLAVGAAFATKASKKFFVTAYVAAAPTSCQTTTKPSICNTIGSQICTLSQTFYQQPGCSNAFRKDP